MKNRKIDLAGTWTLQNQKNQWEVPAQIPGDTHSALLDAEKIQDPYWGSNELDVQWLNQEDWIYSRKFQVDETFLNSNSVFLNCERLDTITEIFINGTSIGITENMFTRYRFEVKSQLIVGENQINIHFKSAEKHAIALNETMPYTIPHNDHDVQSPHRNLVRKPQCHGGWDWGCCLMVSGIYGDISLVSAPQGRIDHVYCGQNHSAHQCELTVYCEVEASQAGESLLEVTLGNQQTSAMVNLTEGFNQVSTTLVIENPELWWPAGYGDHPLYRLTVQVAGDVIQKQIGLRIIELISEEDEVGLSFKFRVNGVDIFCKGSNWIPADALPQRETRAVLDDLLSSAVEANMNMIRVWGGGQYESDDFYDLCDEKGLLIWQDFMFACAMYPAVPEFLKNVEQEAMYQVKRLRDHACLALWCGNNEDVGALTWFEETRNNRDRYLVDYDRLNEGVLGRVADQHDPTRTFWPSSPCGGRGDYSDAFHNDNRGDMHYWGVWHEGKLFESFYEQVPRFCSEFGYQSFPSLETIKTYAPENQMNVTAPIMEHHQRSPSGNSNIIEMFSRYFRMPEGFENFVYLSQVQQGVAIKTAVEYWRCCQPVCMGALFWQLNDNWPVASWASLNYGGKWKLLHYMAKRFYTPTMVTAIQKDNVVEVWAVNDRRESKTGDLMIEVYDFHGNRTQQIEKSVSVAAGQALRVDQFQQSELIETPSDGFLLVTLTVDGEVFRNELFFARYKACDFLPAAIATEVEETAPQQWTIRIKTDKPAFYLTFNVGGVSGEFDDNGFTLIPEEVKTIQFRSKKEKITTEHFKSRLSYQHLRMTYQ